MELPSRSSEVSRVILARLNANNPALSLQDVRYSAPRSTGDDSAIASRGDERRERQEWKKGGPEENEKELETKRCHP